MGYGPGEEEEFRVGRGVFIVNEGNFGYGYASLSYYNPEVKYIENEVFNRANAQKLGDVAQSMTIHNGIGWIVVNNSGVVFAVDPDTFREVGRITGLTSPRYIHFLSDEKAYITQLWDSRIFVVNPKTYEITGYVETDMNSATGSTEQMVRWGGYVYTNCWSYQRRILKIDTVTDEVVGELEVGWQPTSLVLDGRGKMWTVTDGGDNGQETPALYRIDPESFTVEQKFEFTPGDHPSEVALDGDGDEIYWINGSVWRMDVTADRLPDEPFIEQTDTIFYGLTVDPQSGDVYIADAIDHQQNGVVMRYSSDGELLDTFGVGINPGAFCWKNEE